MFCIHKVNVVDLRCRVRLVLLCLAPEKAKEECIRSSPIFFTSNIVALVIEEVSGHELVRIEKKQTYVAGA